MRIAFNPSTVAALTTPPNNKDITFDLRGQNIFARGVKFYGTDTNTWRPVVDSLTSNSTTGSLSANQGRVLKSLIDTLSTDISNQYALRDGSNATGRWRGGLACFDVRDTNYIPRDLNMGLELLFLRNNTNDLNDGGIYNGVFSFRQWASASDWSGGKAHQLSFTDNGNIWHRTSNGDDSWETWKKLAYSTDIPSSLKNPYALTISLNGTSQGPYDGSAAKSINITPSSIGAAISGHTHDDRYLKLTGGTMQLGEGLKFHADDNYFGTNEDARIISLLDGNDKVCDGGLIIDERGTLNGKEYVTELLRIRDSEFKWKGSNILHSGNYSSILDSRYYTESEVNSLLSKKLNTSDFNWTSLPGKIVVGNEFNIVNAGFKDGIWFNYLPINDRNKTAMISNYSFGNGARGYASVTAFGFIKTGSSSSYVLLGDGGHKTESSLNVANADTVDGVHIKWGGSITKTEWLAAWENYNTIRCIAPANVSVGNADKVDGFHATSGNNKPWGTIPVINTSGYMDIGKHLEFHYDNTTGSDYSTALMCTGNHGNIVNLPSASGTLALTSQVLTWKSQIIDMRNYSGSYWHPVTVPLPYTGYNKIKVSVQLNSGDKPSWAEHPSGITCNMEIWATASGWGTTNSETICLNYTYKQCSQNPCGWMQLGYPSLGVLFLRGGSRYRVYTDFDATFTPHDQKYTWTSGSYSQNTGGPYTSCPGLNFNKNKIYANLDGYASRLEGGSIPGWGTLTAANGFTNVSSYDYGSNGAYGLCGKNSALYMQLDGYFYQNEGKYRVLDTSDLSSVTNHIMVSQYTTGDTNYPLVWSSQSNTNSAVGNQLYKSWADLYYNPKNKRLYTNRYVGNYANLTQTSMRHIDADLNSKNTDHTLYIGYGAQTYTAGTNIYASTGSGDTTNARYLLAQFNTSAGINLNGNINTRPSIIFRNEASYKTTLSYSTAGNEALCFETKSAVTSIIFYNGATYAATSNHWYDIINGVQIKNNCLAIGAGWANGVNPDYKLKVGGNSYFAGHLIANNISSSWLDGQRYNRAGYNLQDVSGTGSYYPWMRQTNTGSAKWFSIGILNNSFYILGSKTSRTENSYDYAWRFDLSNGWAYGNFSNADTVDGVHLEWSGSLTYDQYSYLAAWTNDGKKIKAVHKSQFASSGHTHSNYVTALGTSGNYLTWVKNGSTNNITVPYAATSSYLTNGFSATYVNKWDCNAPDRVVYSDYGSSGRSITNAPSGWVYGTLLELGHTNYRGLNGSLNIQLMWDVAHNTTNPGTLWFRGRDNVKGWAKSWAKVITDQNISSILGNYYWANAKISASPSTGTSPTFNTAYTSNWFRSSGSSGWYSQTYGGGIYMIDTSWIRAYGNKGIVAKNFYASNWASATYLLRSDGGAAAFNWSGQSGQPTWLWGGNSQHSYYVYNPSNFSVKYAASAGAVAWGNITGKPSTFTPSSHTHTYIVAEDLRARYPGQILAPQRMKLSFLAASTLGIKNDGTYYDAITVRSYVDSSGGSDNALLFSKNTNSLYHTRFAFGSTDSWGSPLLIIDSGNIGSQSVAYASKAGSVAWSNVTGRPSSLKNPYSLNVFGVAYDGSAAKTVTTSTFISQVSEATSTITDGTMLITSYASNSGFADTNAVNVPYKRKAVHLWDYIDGKVSTKYLPLAGGTMNANARISHGNGNLYIGRADNNGWVYTQDIASHAGTDKWSIRTSGAARFGSIYIASKTDTSFNSNVIECTSSMHLNHFSSQDVSLCNGGGTVQIGPYTTSDTGNNKLYVNGSEFINGASNVRQHVYADGFRHRGHNSNDAVLLAGGGYSQGVPVKYWSIVKINIQSDRYAEGIKMGGNYTFLTNVKPYKNGSCVLTLQFPSGYNYNNTMVWAMGQYNKDPSSSGCIYATIVVISVTDTGAKCYLNLADDATLNNGVCQLYFMCF